MFGNVTSLVGLHVTGEYRDRSMQRTCSMHAAWDPHTFSGTTRRKRSNSGSDVFLVVFERTLSIRVRVLLTLLRHCLP